MPGTYIEVQAQLPRLRFHTWLGSGPVPLPILLPIAKVFGVEDLELLTDFATRRGRAVVCVKVLVDDPVMAATIHRIESAKILTEHLLLPLSELDLTRVVEFPAFAKKVLETETGLKLDFLTAYRGT